MSQAVGGWLRGHPHGRGAARILCLLALYVAVGLAALVLVAGVSILNDLAAECSCGRYATFESRVVSVGAALYLVAAIPMLVLRQRRRAWLVPLLAGFLAMLGYLTAMSYAPECACGSGLRG